MAISALGVGTWAWGDEKTWGMGGYDPSLTVDTIEEAWSASIDAGATFFDTAEVYGSGESERIIGGLLANDPGRAARVQLATKFMPVPWKLNVRSALAASLRASLERLGLESVDLYQIHGPISLRGHAALAEAMAEVHQAGLVRAVGVSNYSVRETRVVRRAAAEAGPAPGHEPDRVLPAAPGPGDRRPSGHVRRARGAAAGLLPAGAGSADGQVLRRQSATGQSELLGPSRWRRSTRSWPSCAASARQEGGRTPGQVALNWIMAKGAVPIPGAKNRRQAEDNAGALGWAMGADAVAALDAVALEGVRSLSSRFWQHG